jgi:hypothetical protein
MPTHEGTPLSWAYNASSDSINYTVSGSDRYLLAFIFAVQGDADPTSISYGGVSLGSPLWTGIINGTVSIQIKAYGLKAPATGTNVFALATATSKLWRVSVSSYNGVHQTTPTRTVTTQSNSDANLSPSFAVSNSQSSDLVVGQLIAYSGTVSLGSGQTVILNQRNDFGGSVTNVVSYKTPSGSTNFDYTIEGGGYGAFGAVPLIAAAGELPPDDVISPYLHYAQMRQRH